MFSCARSFSIIGVFVWFGLLLSGCSQSPEDARKELAALGAEYTAEEFVRAAYNGDIVMVELFLAAEMDVNRRATLTSDFNDGTATHTALSAASIEANMDVVTSLLNAGAKANMDGIDFSALAIASSEGHESLVELLLENGADVDFGGDENLTPLMRASLNGHKGIVERLLEEDADVTSISAALSYSAVQLANIAGHSDIVELLIDAGATLEESTEPRRPDIPFRADGVLEFVDENGARLEVVAIEIAETDSTRQRGLMDRRSLPERGGMLLIFDDEDVRTFEMSNIQIAVDFLFISADSEVVSMETDTRPLSDERIRSAVPSKYVVKVNAGFANRHGITESAHMRLRRR